MAGTDSTTVYSAPLEARCKYGIPHQTEVVIYGVVMEETQPHWPNEPKRSPQFELPVFPLPVTHPTAGMPEQCRSRLVALRSERAAIESRLPVLDAEIETLEKMLAAIGEK